MKKINCKHGLTSKEEIEARRLKSNILEGDGKIFEERFVSLYNTYKKQMNGGFYEYILKNDKVMYSAFERIGGIRRMYYYLSKYKLI